MECYCRTKHGRHAQPSSGVGQYHAAIVASWRVRSLDREAQRETAASSWSSDRDSFGGAWSSTLLVSNAFNHYMLSCPLTLLMDCRRVISLRPRLDPLSAFMMPSQPVSPAVVDEEASARLQQQVADLEGKLKEAESKLHNQEREFERQLAKWVRSCYCLTWCST